MITPSGMAEGIAAVRLGCSPKLQLVSWSLKGTKVRGQCRRQRQRGGLPGSRCCFMFRLAIRRRTGGEVHIFPAHYILWHYLTSLCRGEWELAVHKLNISRSAALCRQFLALESQDIRTGDVNVLKCRPHPFSTPGGTLRNSSLSTSSITDGSKPCAVLRPQHFHPAISHNMPSVQAQRLIQPISPSSAGSKAKPQMPCKKQTLRLQPAHQY